MTSIKVVPTGSVVVDSLPFSGAGTLDQADRLECCGVSAVVGYLGVMSVDRLRYVLDGGLGFMPVTLAGEYEDGAQDELAQLRALGIPAGVTVWLDLEGMKAWKDDPVQLCAKIDAWAAPVADAGYVAGLYCGVPQPLTSKELGDRPRITRYWAGQGRQVDRFGNLSEPTAGYCMRQFFPSVTWCGVLLDANMTGQDYRGRLPTMLVAG